MSARPASPAAIGTTAAGSLSSSPRRAGQGGDRRRHHEDPEHERDRVERMALHGWTSVVGLGVVPGRRRRGARGHGRGLGARRDGRHGRRRQTDRPRRHGPDDDAGPQDDGAVGRDARAVVQDHLAGRQDLGLRAEYPAAIREHDRAVGQVDRAVGQLMGAVLEQQPAVAVRLDRTRRRAQGRVDSGGAPGRKRSTSMLPKPTAMSYRTSGASDGPSAYVATRR